MENEIKKSEQEVSAVDSTDSAFSTYDAFVPSYYGGANSQRFIGSNSVGFNASISFTDILSGYSYYGTNNNYSSYNYDIGGYSNGNTSVKYFSESSVSSSSSYTQSTFYNVGDHNGYLSNYNNKNGVMNFVDVNISSWECKNDYVRFDMGNGTSF